MRARGDQLPHSKLSEADVRAIRANRRGEPARVWAKRLGVHINTIHRAMTGENYSWVQGS